MNQNPTSLPGNENSPGSPFPLIDGATASLGPFLRGLEEKSKIVQNTENSLEDRFEAFEDIIDSEIGDTSLVRARNIEREFGIRQLYLKFEGGNPTGTQKDRIAFAQCKDALRRGFDTICIATCGNYGVATALAASLAGLTCQIFIPESYHTLRIDEMIRLGAKIVRVPGDYETSVMISQETAEREEWYDANPGGSNTLLQLQAYAEIAYEIYDELRDAPKVVASPVSNGTVLAGIHKGFVRLYRRGKTSRIPQMVAGSSFRKNPIILAFEQKKASCEDLNPIQIKETPINEPLINWHSFDGDWALESLYHTDGWARGISDKKMRTFAQLILNKEGIQVLPASTVGLIALIEQHQKTPFQPDRYVAVLTGRKS